MCEECQQFICPSACPNYYNKKDKYCSNCGGVIIDEYMILNNEVYCFNCIDELTIDELLYFKNLTSIVDLLTELGFEKITC